MTEGLRGPELVHLLARRAQARGLIRGFFEDRGYLEVETPSLVLCPGLDSHVHSLGGVTKGGEPAFLITSPEFHMKRLLASGAERIYQFAHCFRAEELGPWHEPEFTMLEWYRAGASFADLLEETELLLRGITQSLEPSGLLRRAGRSIDVARPFVRLSVKEAFREFAHEPDVVDLARSRPDQYFQCLVDHVEPALAQFDSVVCLTHYPISQAGLARAAPHDPDFAERFEVFALGLELSNGFGELTDAQEQRRRFESELERRRAAQEPLYPIDEEFLAALPFVPPSIGNALGFDRWLALVLGAESLAEVMPFPVRRGDP